MDIHKIRICQAIFVKVARFLSQQISNRLLMSSTTHNLVINFIDTTRNLIPQDKL